MLALSVNKNDKIVMWEFCFFSVIKTCVKPESFE